MNRAPLALLLLAAGVAVAGGDDAVVDGRDWDRTQRYAYPVIISAIDGKSYMDLKRRALAPGRHKLEFRSTWVPPARRFVASQELEVELAPCTVYRFYARHKGAFSSDWELVALPPEKLERCGK